MKIKISKSEKMFQVFNYIFLTLLSVICIYPLYFVLMSSFSEAELLLAAEGLILKPLGFTLEAYKRVLGNPQVWSGYKNTMILLVTMVSWQMIMTTLGAYVLSRSRLMFRRPLMLMITFTMFFSGGTIPFYMNLKELGMIGHLWGMLLPFSISTYNMIILRTAFESIPESLIEAAEIDGAGHLTILARIVLPVSKATMAVLVLYYAVGVWNSWFWASYILPDRESRPLAVVLREILISNEMQQMDSGMPTAENIKYALIIVATVPILLIYPFIQKYFTQGVMIGAVKE